jgi:LPS-assembly lipoprotein
MILAEKSATLRRSSSRLPVGAILTLVLSSCLLGCFKPLYGGASGVALNETLKEVQIDPIPDRVGHYLGDALIFAFNGSGSTVEPKYRLKVTPTERVETPVVNTVTGQATSATVLADAQYVLTSVGDDKPLTQGTAFTSAAYDRSLQEFANIEAARDAEVRDADSLADEIRIRVAAYFADHPDPR